jgi:hypothetical protein
MASSFSTLGIELIATGEASGLWGDKTNVNLQMFQEITSGYVAQSIAGGAQTTALSITNATTGDTARQMIIEFTGTISGNQIVTIPDSLEKMYIIKNSTSGAHTVQFKTVSGSGVTFGASDKGTKLVFANGTNVVDAGLGGGIDLNGEELILDEDADTSITADTDDQIDIKIAGADDFRFTANTFTALSGSSVVIPDSGLTLGSTAVTSTAAELNILDGVTSTAAELNILDGVTSTAAELNILDGATVVVGEINALDLGSTAVGTAIASKAVILDSNKDYTGIRNLTLTGDLTVGGDDITMGTNTAGNLLVADGTNFNSIAISSLSEISTAASDDVFIAIDTSGGGLKKIARSAVVAGLATDSAISNVVDDTSPQLGGNLDTNSQNILIDDAHFIADENGNEQIIFQTTSSAVNQFDITNAATGSGPKLQATGGDSNIDLNIEAKGTGHVTVRGNTNSGAIQFNCESNSHGQIVIAQPHSAGVTNTLTLPAGASSTLVSLVSTDTLTNKTLTSPKINEDVAVTSTATEINVLDGITAVVGELNALDLGSTAVGTAIASKAVILDSNKDYTGIRNFTISGEIDAATGDFSGAVDVAGATTTAAITASGIIKTDATTNATSTTDGSLQTDGGLSVVLDAIFGDDVSLLSDASVLKFGADAEVTLTHVHNDGLLLNSDNQLQFRDSAINIRSDADGDLDINADDEVEINSTLIDINGNVEISGTLAQAGIATFAVAANVTQGALTSSSNAVAWDASAKPNAVHVTTENTTFSAPSNAVEGAFIVLEINYNGSHTIAFNTIFEFAASTAPTFTSTDAKTDILVFRYNGSVWQEVGRTLNLSES